MKIFIRTDSSLKIGTGHVMRCLTLAQILTKSNYSVTFICRSLEGNVISLIREKQFKIIELTSPSESEIDELSPILDQEVPDWIVVDHYFLGVEWERSVKQKGIKVLVIDDILGAHFCDALIDQNYRNHHKEKILGQLEKPLPTLFLGPEYALLSESFRRIAPTDKNFVLIRNALVFFGGTDASGETQKFLNLIPRLYKQINFNIVVGKTNASLDLIKEESAKISNVTLHIQTNKMAEFMRDADIFIGSGGISTWERCYLGLPSLCIAVAENQVEISQNLHDMNVLTFIGRSNEISEEDFIKSFQNFLGNTSKLRTLSENSKKLQVSSKIDSILNCFK